MTARERENERRRYARSLLAVYETADDHARTYGAQWYADALEQCAAVAYDERLPLLAVVGACAALSPRNHWTDNVADLRALCAWYADPNASGGFEPFDSLCRRLSCFAANADKAERILRAGAADPLDILRGPKERAFYRNIIGETDAVTVDVWATRAATRGQRDTPRSRADYRVIESAYRRAARAVGVAPRDFQAAVWLALRSLTRDGSAGGGGWARIAATL